jgi:hypothetical protein
MSEKPEVIIIREGVLESWARDAVTFGALAGASYFINVYAGGSGWLNFTLAIAWFAWVAGRGAAHRIKRSPAEARAWLDEHFPVDPVSRP